MTEVQTLQREILKLIEQLEKTTKYDVISISPIRSTENREYVHSKIVNIDVKYKDIV